MSSYFQGMTHFFILNDDHFLRISIPGFLIGVVIAAVISKIGFPG
jgi:hypothetical protein